MIEKRSAIGTRCDCAADRGGRPPSSPGLMGATVPEPCLIRVAQTVVAGVFQVSPADLRAASRGPAHVALARQVAMYLCHVSLGFDHGRVARAFGRDRTTASHACKVVEDRRDDPEFERRIAILDGVFKGFQDAGGCRRCQPRAG